MLSLSDTLAVVGALAVGAMLDVAIRAPVKARFSDWLTGLATRAQAVNYGGSAFLDRWFGRSVLSWNAVPRYALISVVSITLSYLFAVGSSPPDVQPAITIFRGHISGKDVAILAICLLAAIAGDVFSYAQTRLFVREIDRSRSPVVALGLVAADVIVSLSIFFVMFSFARLLCVLLVLQAEPVQTLSNTEQYVPSLLASALEEAQIEVGSDKESVTTFAVAVANSRTPAQLERVAAWQRNGVATYLADPKSLKHVTFTASRSCVAATREGRGEAADALLVTELLFEAVVAEQSQRRPITRDTDAIRDKMSSNYLAALVKAREAGSEKCFLELTSVRSSIRAADLIAAAGPHNAWWASFERTLFDAYQVVGFKLAPYVGFDPYNSAPAYVGSLKQQLQNSFLGALPIDGDRAAIVSYLDDPVTPVDGQVNVPFSPMVASSLTTSAFLIAYLLSLALASVREKSLGLFRKILPAFDFERAVFTSLSVAMVFVFLGVSLLLWLAQLIWGVSVAGL